MNQVKIKPLSVNKAWQGKRYKTPEYKDYRMLLRYTLPDVAPIPKPMLLYVRFYVSSKASDLDNLLKPFIDALQDKYGFDDKEIYEIHCSKRIVKKGEESITFNFEQYDL